MTLLQLDLKGVNYRGVWAKEVVYFCLSGVVSERKAAGCARMVGGTRVGGL